MWMDELKKIRRFLRDPDGNIWSEPYLRRAWNDVQKDVQHRTSVLEDAVTQRIPDLYHLSYMHDFELQYMPSKYSEFYQCLRKHDDYTYSYNWEPQEITGISSDTSEYGIHFTQPWEAFMGSTPGEEVRFKFPKNFRDVKFMAYDEQPIEAITRKVVQHADASYITHQGTPVAWYPHESEDWSYVLYPRPGTAFIEEIDGEGVAFYVEDDTEDTDVGTIAIRTGSSESGNVGAAVDIVGTQDNIFLVFDINPTDMQNISDEPDFPAYLTKYVRFGVLAKAFKANTDGRIPSLARFWDERYNIGIEIIRKFMKRRKADRDYRLTTMGRPQQRRRREPRLPDNYPHP